MGLRDGILTGVGLERSSGTADTAGSTGATANSESTDDKERIPDGSGRPDIGSFGDDGGTDGPSNGQDGSAEDDPESWGLFLRDVLVSIASVLLLGFFLFAISGVWPPMVAIESGSMNPNMEINDLTFVMDTDRFEPAASEQVGPGDTGIVTAHVGADEGYTKFGNSGDVIVFRPNGNGKTTPVIHRAMFWVEEDEDWIERANPAFLAGAEECHQIASCPAPHAGFITKGDNNPAYDQLGEQIARPIKPSWIVGTAELRIPWLGWFRLQV